MLVFLLFLIIAHNSTSFWKGDVIKERFIFLSWQNILLFVSEK